jgi:hypothetical protein
MKIIIVSRNVMQLADFESLKDKIVAIEVPPLEELEAADFI